MKLTTPLYQRLAIRSRISRPQAQDFAEDDFSGVSDP
jgi:hypothetical protein